MKTIRILILEDDLETISVLTNRLFSLEQTLGINNNFDIAVTIFSEYTQVENYLNKDDYDPDLVILDYDCKACGCFHVLDFEKFDPKKIIAISTQPEYNSKVTIKGAFECRKDYASLADWGDRLAIVVSKYLKNE